jgi:transposase
VKFSISDCSPCVFRSQCTRASRRSLSLRPQAYTQALEAAREREKSAIFVEAYAQRAGIEGTISQGVRGRDLRRARYRGMAKTHLQHVLIAVGINLTRLIHWLNGEALSTTRTSAFAQLYHSTT